MPSQILTTKLYIPPPRANLVSRPRLFDCLRMGSDNKLTLISAPAGYGKTTLLSEWISKSKIPFGWLSLDEHDNNLYRFLNYLIASLQSISIKVDAGITASIEPNQSNQSETLLIPLINQIAAQERRFALVLDDYHRVQNVEVHQAVTYLLENLPTNMHLVIATRTDPPFRLAQMRARGELCEIRAEDLQFSNEEAFDFLNKNMELGLSSFDITTISEKTEGWIAGLQLAAISLQGHHDKPGFVRAFAGDDRYIADYLLDEAIHRQPSHIQTFLLQTSILDRFCAPLCNAVTGVANSQMVLTELEHANLFLIPLDNQRNWFRYHQLFADLLINHLHQTMVDDVPVLHKKASTWYQENSLFSDAVNHALAANDLERIVQLTEEMAVYNMDSRESIALLEWLDSLPESAFYDHPWLLVARTWALFNIAEYSAVEDNLVEIRYILANSSLSPELAACIRGHIAAIQSNLAELRGDDLSVIQRSEEALALLPAKEIKLRSFLSIRRANCLIWFGDYEKAIPIYQEVGEASKQIGDGHLAITALSELAAVQMVAGRLQEAEENINLLNNYADMLALRDGRRLPAMGILYRHMSYIKRERNELFEAEYYANEAVKICQQWGEKEALLFSVLALTRVQYSKGEYRKVDQNCKRFLEIASQISPKAVEQFRIWALYLQLLQENIEETRIWVHELGLTASDEFGYESRYEYQNLALYLTVIGNYTQALKINITLLKVVEHVCDMVLTIQHKLLQAVILDKINKTDEAMIVLEEALSFASAEGYVRTILDQGESVIRLIYQAAQKGINPQFCLKLLDEVAKHPDAAFKLSQDLSTGVTSDLVEPLSDREIEVLQNIAEGCTNQEIAQELVLSLYTVKSHARNIYSKLGVKNRTEAVARGRLLGLLRQE